MCNFNYKVRQDSGHMGIFEVNTRVGADLACDVPRARARRLFAKMDAVWEEINFEQPQQHAAGPSGDEME